ncbi:ABC transporter permease [Ktedonosporobacter rubrisoli]|uniref:ABC transporter permease n=1 Tax=Ktedonosporobacter rubrisoli TaxID=2509675 RepID=A0A4P6JQC5_KTERU|nr:ABC transporter permease [Ktedonosporobacter rubrisoli]QBD76966.1 ABC transporter permease [Ktedonosporobacter rubrisoli]
MSTPPFNETPLANGDEMLHTLQVTNSSAKRGSANMLALIAIVGRSIWRLINLNRKMLTGSIIVGGFILLAIFGPLLARFKPDELSADILQPPSALHWLGTTQAGQDVFAQVMLGTRYSIFWGLLTAILVTFIYMVFGLSAAYFGGKIDDILTLITNVFLVLPGIPLALALAAYIPYKGPLTVVAVIAITGWPGHARIVRSQALTLRQRDFVAAAQISGLPAWQIIFAEIFPNMLAVVASGFVGTMLAVILAAAGLEFLGLGDIRSISWGSMFYWAQNSSALLQGAWWWFIPPGVCIALLGAGLTFINLGLDEIADPRLRSETRPLKFLRSRKRQATSTTKSEGPEEISQR